MTIYNQYKEDAREWLLHGGGGFEGTPEATRFTFEGLVVMLADYRGYLEENSNEIKDMLSHLNMTVNEQLSKLAERYDAGEFSDDEYLLEITKAVGQPQHEALPEESIEK